MPRRAVSLALALAFASALVAPVGSAGADRPPVGRPAPVVRRNPGRLGKGFMSDVFLSRDGRHVIKKVKPTLGGVVKLSRPRRALLAARAVRVMDVIRAAGVPVPAAAVPAGHPDMIVQEFARDGVSLAALPWKARPRALLSAFRHYTRAVRAVRRAGMRGVLVDPKLANFKFAADGRVVSWFDPAGVGGPLHWLNLRSRMLVARLLARWRR